MRDFLIGQIFISYADKNFNKRIIGNRLYQSLGHGMDIKWNMFRNLRDCNKFLSAVSAINLEETQWQYAIIAFYTDFHVHILVPPTALIKNIIQDVESAVAKFISALLASCIRFN